MCKLRYLSLFLPLLSLCGQEVEMSHSPSLFEKKLYLCIENRPLAKIDQKTLTLSDVIKKMDLMLFMHAPDFHPTRVEKHEFYTSQWARMLDSMIEDELILLDAEQKGIKIPDGKVREELEMRFGSDKMSNLDRFGLSYEEASAILRTQLTIEQLLGVKVYAKAMQIATPQKVREEYLRYLERNPMRENWAYQVLSIRGEDRELCEQIAWDAYRLLKEKEGSSFQEVVGALDFDQNNTSVSISKEYEGDTPSLSHSHRSALATLSPGSCSEPVSQESAHDKCPVMRLFHLKDKKTAEIPPFEEIYEELYSTLFERAAEKEKGEYVAKLKRRFGYDKCDPKFALPEGYTPFSLYEAL